MAKCGGNFRGNRDYCIIKRFTGVNWDCTARAGEATRRGWSAWTRANVRAAGGRDDASMDVGYFVNVFQFQWVNCDVVCWVHRSSVHRCVSDGGFGQR